MPRKYDNQNINKSLPQYQHHGVDLVGSPIDHSRIIETAKEFNREPPKTIDKCVHQLFESQARKRPDETAIDAWDGHMTYSELDHASNRLGHYLVNSFNVQPQDMVHICFEKSIWAYVSILAINKAGGAWVPLDPRHPHQRQHQIVEQTGARLCLVSATNVLLCTGLCAETLDVSSDLDHKLIAQFGLTPSAPGINITPEHAAYVLFTSGSTGIPKGVVMGHKAMCTSQTAIRDRLGMTSFVRILQFAAYVFDVCVGEIVGPLITGAAICVPPDSARMNGGLVQFMEEKKVNWAFLTSSFARTLKPADTPSLEFLLLTGEAVSRDVFDSWIGKVRLAAGWGPTETCVFSTLHEWHSKDESHQTIGRPVGGFCWIVDPDNSHKLAPIGSAGELVVHGPTLLREYLGDPARTAASTITDLPGWAPNAALEGWGRFYKSGDLGSYNLDGTIEFIGRKDTQVKIRGHRVELGEVEHHVHAALPIAKQVAVDVFQGHNGPVLGAYFCLNDEIRVSGGMNGLLLPMTDDVKSQITTAVKHMAAALPSHMNPTAYFPCQFMPFISSMKLDRPKLRKAAMDLPITDMLAYKTIHRAVLRQPSTSLQSQIRSLWSQLLSVQEELISINDNFYFLGGDSIQLVTLTKMIYNEYKIMIGRGLLNDKSLTVYGLSEYIANSDLREKGPVKVDLMARLSSIMNTTLRSHPRELSNNCTARLPQNSTILLTGATGYLGAEILRQLLNLHSVGKVVVLVRATSPEEGLDRIRKIAGIWQWWENNTNKSKIEVWVGDLSQTCLGLNNFQRQRLFGGAASGNIDAIIHNGAVVNWNADFNTLRAANVVSTIDLLKACTDSPAHPKFVYVSGGAKIDIHAELSASAEMLSESNGYSQTKFLSEAVVRTIISNLPADQTRFSTVKPGLIIGSVDKGISNTDDFLWRMASAAAQMQAYPQEPANHWLQISNVQTVADAIIRQMFIDAPTFGAHIELPSCMPVTSFWDSLNSKLKIRCAPVALEEWIPLALDHMDKVGESHPLWPVQHFLGYLGKPLLPTHTTPTPRDILPLQYAVMSNVEYLQRIGFIPTKDEMAVSSTGYIKRSAMY